jgi:hypothetical protein
MGSRAKVILGSALGAVAIHTAFVACGTVVTTDAGHDGGFADVVRDAFEDVLEIVTDAEVREANAQDSGEMDAQAGDTGVVRVCDCPPAPTLTKSFAIRVDQGRGIESPIGEFSQTFATIGPRIPNTPPLTGPYGFAGSASAYFFTADGARFSVSCSFQLNVDGSIDQSVGPSECELTRNPAGFTSGQSKRTPLPSVEVIRHTETQLEVRFPQISFDLIPVLTSDGGVDRVTISDFVVRVSDPTARYLTPANSYVP